ncbi:MAG: gamma-glutamyltransferase [Alphaproteobacteria bacterium]|nr:gamma-glutamyltransferase [Alphaproteobacteria bacterium]
MSRIAVLLSAAFLAAAGASAAAVAGQATVFDQVGAITSRTALAADRPVEARHAMVVTAQHYATEAGLEILKKGGNAIDAAVAVGYALAVVDPCCGNLGGGGFMTVHLASGRNLFLDFREKAPLKATPTLYQDAQGNVVPGLSTKSWLSIGVPGTVMGLNEALARYGTMSRAEVMAPAIRLAREGFRLSPADVKRLESHTAVFAKEPNVAAIFLNHGKPYRVGEVLKQPQLAHTLELIAKDGDAVYYKGPIAHAIVAASKTHGGILSLRDFADYTVNWEKPVSCDYRGYTIESAPPPSSGGTTMCEILQIIKPYPFSKWGYASVKATHYLVEAERRAFADRNSELGDPAFVHNPVAELISPAHAAKLRASIKPDAATPSSAIKGGRGPDEGTHTTHFSVVDAKGNAVSTTYTLNFLFGNGKIAGDTGFFLNDEMDDFTSKPGVPNGYGLVQGKANEIEPGKRPLSSMTPTIVLHNGHLFMVTGSPGGSTIISTVLESILNVIDFHMNMKQAVDAPRVHQQWLPDVVFVEPGYLTAATRPVLNKMGYRFRVVPSIGADEAILRSPRTGLLEGANDARRRTGLAAGY